MEQSYSDFNPNTQFTVYEQPHQGSMRTWQCINADEFVAKCTTYYANKNSWQEFEMGYETLDENGEYAGSRLAGGDWNEVRKFIGSDMQWCVLIND